MSWPVFRRPTARLAGILVAAAVTAAGYGIDAGAAATEEVLGPGEVTVDLDMRHSRFSEDRLQVRAGTLVHFRISNHDPINHEFIVGPPEVHAAHETGDEAFHPPVPGEVSVGAGESASTVYQFDEPGTVEFICHLPGHAAYGMVGEVEVI